MTLPDFRQGHFVFGKRAVKRKKASKKRKNVDFAELFFKIRLQRLCKCDIIFLSVLCLFGEIDKA